MKKTALTIGLFSLVAVATSFASTEINGNVSKLDTIVSIDPGQNGNLGRRKVDVTLNQDNLNSFSKDSQSIINKKLD